MANLHDLSDDGLVSLYDEYCERVRIAPGWSSAYAEAKYLKHICNEASARGMTLINPFPIVKG